MINKMPTNFSSFSFVIHQFLPKEQQDISISQRRPREFLITNIESFQKVIFKRNALSKIVL